MSWNEPGGDDKKDPWGGRKGENSPPDLDEVIRSFQEKLGGLFGGGSGGGDSEGGTAKGLSMLVIAGLVLWSLSGFYIIDEGREGVVTRFGAYQDTTDPGLNWHFPTPIETVDRVNKQKIQVIEVGYRSRGRQGIGPVPREALMLTKDENIVNVQLEVQYKVKDAKAYLFNVANPVTNPGATLKQVTESVERGVIGRSDMDFILTGGRAEIVIAIKEEVQIIMDSYKSGILVTTVNLQDAQAPNQVQAAFEDVIKAREDKERFINEAQAYSNEVIPVARGAASRKIQEAEAYKEGVIAQANGEVSRFSQLLKEYKKAPKVTRQRIYLESMEDVLSKTSTVMVDVKGGNNLLYLPLDKLGNKASNTGTANITRTPKKVVSQPVNNTSNARYSSRSRDVRGR